MKCLENRNWKHIKVKRKADASVTQIDASGVSEATGAGRWDYVLSPGSPNKALSTGLPGWESPPCYKWVPTLSVQRQRKRGGRRQNLTAGIREEQRRFFLLFYQQSLQFFLVSGSKPSEVVV